MLEGCLPYVEKFTSWIMMFLVDGYQDDMLSRMTTISGGGGCKAFVIPGTVGRGRAKPHDGQRTWARGCTSRQAGTKAGARAGLHVGKCTGGVRAGLHAGGRASGRASWTARG